MRHFEEGKSLSGGSFNSNLSFVQAPTEALKAVLTAVLLTSLPEPDKALASLSHYFGRIQALWKQVSIEEAFRSRALRKSLTNPHANWCQCQQHQ